MYYFVFDSPSTLLKCDFRSEFSVPVFPEHKSSNRRAGPVRGALLFLALGWRHALLERVPNGRAGHEAQPAHVRAVAASEMRRAHARGGGRLRGRFSEAASETASEAAKRGGQKGGGAHAGARACVHDTRSHAAQDVEHDDRAVGQCESEPRATQRHSTGDYRVRARHSCLEQRAKSRYTCNISLQLTTPF